MPNNNYSKLWATRAASLAKSLNKPNQTKRFINKIKKTVKNYEPPNLTPEAVNAGLNALGFLGGKRKTRKVRKGRKARKTLRLRRSH